MSSKSYFEQYYADHVAPEMKKKFGFSNVHEIPKLNKIVINSGFKATREKAWTEEVRNEISRIAGQRALVTKASKSVSNFKLREGMPVGAKVTLRGERMYDFLYRFIAIALPNIRDFRGVSGKLDGRGNYTIGIEDSTIFPEINTDTSGRDPIGMDITIVTTAESDELGRELLALFGMPFRKATKSGTEAEAEVEEGAEAVAAE